MDEFLAYMGKRALALENSSRLQEQAETGKRQPSTSYPKGQVSLAAAANKALMECIYCKCTDHKLYLCPKFKLQPSKENGLCDKCLNRLNGKCKFYFRCGQCKQNHHSLLHLDESDPVVLLSGNCTTNVIIPTARVKLFTKSGREVHFKCILDSGSGIVNYFKSY